MTYRSRAMADLAVLEAAPAAEEPARRPRWRGWVRRGARWTLTALAALLVFYALVGPNQLGYFGPRMFLRLPLEGLIGAALMLVLPPTARRILAVPVGVLLGLLTLLKLVDVGFYESLDREFNPVVDWYLLGDAADFVRRSDGGAAGVTAVVAVVLLVLAVLVFMVLAVMRLTRLLVRYRGRATRTVAALGVVWVLCAAFGLHLRPGVPLAANEAAALTYDRGVVVYEGLQDQRSFAADAAVDAFRGTPGDQLLTGLRGKDVVLTFVESYGRVALEDPVLGPQLAPLLDDGYRRLRAAGFDARSGFLTSPTFGGGSWLAHSTLLSGLWINGAPRYNNLLASDRFTLNKAFKKAGWHTVSMEPAVTGSWPESGFYGYDKLDTARTIGYRGPLFNFASIPDQYTMSVFHRDNLAAPNHPPTMAEIVLLSSHAPWAPLPKLVDWNALGDGSVYSHQAPYDPIPATPSQIRAAYLRSIQYSVGALVSYVETYGDKNLVLVFLGDHQPAPVVSGSGASRDVPVTIVARDPAVLDRIAGWGWQDGLHPDPHAPVWRMDSFRDRFLTAFGPRP
jgi:Sulfatase